MLVAIALWAVAIVGTVSAEDRHWSRLGGTGVAAGFAGPAGSAVDEAWFSGDGRRLYVSLQNGTVWASEDVGLTWGPARRDSVEPIAVPAESTADGALRVLRNPYRAGVAYALGQHLYRSDDGGSTWTNLTAIGRESVIGRWQASLAFSPLDPDLIVVGNSMGLWKSYDEGLTWSSLNAGLPNFPDAGFVRSPGKAGPTLFAPALGTLELIRTAGGQVWRATPGPADFAAPPSALDRARRAAQLPPAYAASHPEWNDARPFSGEAALCEPGPPCPQHSITALSAGGRHLWAGTSDGHIWVSADSGESWERSWSDPNSGLITSLWTDPGLPSTALAIARGRVLRTTNGGTSWFDISSDLPDSKWTVVKGHPATRAVYVAGPLGVRFATTDLDVPGPAGSWTELSGDLPGGGVTDLELDPLRGRLYALVPGYGVHWTRTPQTEHALRVLSAADLSVRPVAPGSLLTIMGASAVRARASGRPAPILDSGPGRTQLQLPFAVRGNSLRLQLHGQGGSHTVDLPLERVAPAIFVVADEPLILDAGSGTLVGWRQPAKIGGTVLVMATGLGEVTPPWPAGRQSPLREPPRVVAQVAATIDGSPAQVLTAQLAPGFVGIYVVEIQIPLAANAGALELVISAGGRWSNAVTLVAGR